MLVERKNTARRGGHCGPRIFISAPQPRTAVLRPFPAMRWVGRMPRRDDRFSARNEMAPEQVETRFLAAMDGAVGPDVPDMEVPFPVRRMSRNAVFAILNTITSLITSLILLPIVLRELGPTLFGISAIAMAAVGYATLFDFGINVVLTRLVAEARARGDLDGSGPISKATTTLLSLYAVIGMVAGIVVLAPALPQVNIFDLEPSQLAVFRQVIFLLAVQTALSFPCSVGNSVLCGLQDFHLTYSISIVSSVARTVVAVVLLQRGMGLVGLTALGLFTAGGTWIANVAVAKWRLPGWRVDRGSLNLRRARALLGEAGSMGVWGVAGYSLHSGDRLLLGLAQPPIIVAEYEVSARLALYSRALLHGWLDTLLPHSAHVGVAAGKGSLQQIYLQGTRSLLAIYGLATTGAMSVGAVFLDVWLGPKNSSSYGVLVLLMASNLVQAHTLAGHVILVGTGAVRPFARVMVGYPVAIVLLGVPLARMGAVGMASAVLFAVMIQEVRVARLLHRTLAPDWRAIVRWAMLPLALACGTGAAAAAVGMALAGGPVAKLLVGGSAACLAYGTAYLVVGVSAHERRTVMRIMRKVFLRHGGIE